MHWSQIQEFQVGYARGHLEVKTEDDNLQEETQNQIWSLEIYACAAKKRLSASL